MTVKCDCKRGRVGSPWDGEGWRRGISLLIGRWEPRPVIQACVLAEQLGVKRFQAEKLAFYQKVALGRYI